MPAEPLEDTTKKEFEKTPEAAKQAAKSANFFDTLGQTVATQSKNLVSSAKILAKIAGTAAVVGAAGYLGYLAFGVDAPVTMGGLIAGNWGGRIKTKRK